MRAKPIPVERARRLLAYDTSSPSGLVWRVTRHPVRAGSPAGSSHSEGYYEVRLDSKLYLAHRLVYAIVTGTDPGEYEIDHIDGDRSNNEVLNLRKVSSADNHRNISSRGGTSKYLGVSWDRPRGKWMARIQVNGRTHHLGRYDLEEDAARAYDAAARELHPGGRLNFPLTTDLNQTPAHHVDCNRDRPHPGPACTGRP